MHNGNQAGLKDDSRAWGKLALVAAGIGGASAGHYLTPPELLLWHNIFQRLYYLPIIYGAISFGMAGGLGAAAASAICYIPHIVLTWHGWRYYSANQYAEIVVFFLVAAVTGILADQSRRRERELRAVYRELENSFEQLKRAERLSAVGQLSAGLAHEIRNPLASIEGAAEILGQPGLSPQRHEEFLGIIRKECRRVNRLLTELLDFARLRPPERRTVAVEPLLDKVANLVARSAEKNSIRIRQAVAPGLPTLVGDPEQLTQVLLNLALNAIQAMPDGGEIVLSARREGNGILMEVRDQGVGVPEEDWERIFDPFFTTKSDGTGLGLSIAHQIVAQHGGAIRAARNPDRGMTFSVWLPGGAA